MRRLALLFLVLASGASGAQDIPLPETEVPEPPPAPSLSSSPRLYGGPALGPGLFAGYTVPRLLVFTQEAALYVDYDPKLFGEGQLRLGVGIGGSVRLLQILEIAGDFDASQVDLDAGVRFGPAFDIPFFSPTGEQRTRAFSVLVDAFVRGQTRLGSNRVVFVELGGSQPALRGGLSIGIGN